MIILFSIARLGIEQGFQNAIAGADRALVVTTPEVSAIRDADRIIGLLEANGFKQMDLIITDYEWIWYAGGDMMSADDVVDILAIPLIGIIPDDENGHCHQSGRTFSGNRYPPQEKLILMWSND